MVGQWIKRKFLKSCTPLLEEQRWDFHGRQNLIEITQNSYTTHTMYGDVRSHTQRSLRIWEMFIALKRITLMARNYWWNLSKSKQMFDMPIYLYSTKETSQCSKWNPITCMAYSRNWFVLLETFWLLSSRWLLLKVLDCKKASKFNWISCLQRNPQHCHRAG